MHARLTKGIFYPLVKATNTTWKQVLYPLVATAKYISGRQDASIAFFQFI